MDFGSLASSFGGGSGLLDIGFGVYDRLTQKDQFNKGFSLSKNALYNKYQISAADMKAAGINPIMAATRGFQTGGGGSGPSPMSPSRVDVASAAALHAQADKNKAEAEYIRGAKTDQTGAEADFKREAANYQRLLGGEVPFKIDQIRVATERMMGDAEWQTLKKKFFENINLLWDEIVRQNSGANSFGAKIADFIYWLNSADKVLLKRLAKVDSEAELRAITSGAKELHNKNPEIGGP